MACHMRKFRLTGLFGRKKHPEDDLIEDLESRYLEEEEDFAPLSEDQGSAGPTLYEAHDDGEESLTVADSDPMLLSDCIFMNVTTRNWSLPYIAEQVKAKVGRQMSKYLLFTLLCGGLLFVPFVLVHILNSTMASSVRMEQGRLSQQIESYQGVVDNMNFYAAAFDMRSKPPIYLQYTMLTLLSIKSGVSLSEISFLKNADTALYKNSFSLHTGKDIDSVKISGVWKVMALKSDEGTLDNDWVLSTSQNASVIYARSGWNAFVHVPAVDSRSGRQTEMHILLWRE